MTTNEDILAILGALAAEQRTAIGVHRSDHTATEAAEFLADQACTALQVNRTTLGNLLATTEAMAHESSLATLPHAIIASLILGARIQRAITDNAHLEATR